MSQDLNSIVPRRKALGNRQRPIRTCVVDEDYLDDIAAAFAQVVDSKSPFTSGHSERVTSFTEIIAYTPRVFVPIDQPAVLAAVLAKWPPQSVLAKAA